MIAFRGFTVAFLVGSIGAVVIGGCGIKSSSTMEPTVEPGESTPPSMTEANRAEQLRGAVAAFADARQGLAGHSDAQSRGQLADALGKLSDVLVLLKGPEANGAFRQQVRIIDRARTQLTSDSATAPEPTVNAALRAAQRALSDMASRQFPDDETTNSLLAALDPRVDVLANERGPLHGFETARAMDSIGAVVQRVAELVQQRLPQPQDTPATDPAVSPE